MRGLIRGIFFHVRDVADLIRLTRFTAILIAAAAVMLLLTGQGLELARSSSDLDNDNLRTILFVAAVVWWAWQSWYWSRLMFELEFGSDRKAWAQEHKGHGWKAFFIANLPRIYSALVFLIAYCFLYVGEHPARRWVALAGVAFYAVLVFRRPVERLLGIGGKRRDRHGGTMFPRIQGELPSGSLDFLRVSLFITLGLMIIAYWAPVNMGSMLGAPTIAFLGFASFVPVLNALLVWAQRYELPIASLLVGVALLFTLTNDNHSVRRHESLTAEAKWLTPEQIDERKLNVAQAVNRFLEANEYDPDKYDSNSDDPIPMVFVSSAGGGMPAAYWTATVLGHLADELPEDFARHLFSLSGVSGGSVGSAIFYSLLPFDSEVVMDHCPAELRAYESTPTLQEKLDSFSYAFRGHSILCTDFLGPAIAGLLYQDTLLQFLPVDPETIQENLPLVDFEWPIDRAYAIERAMELGWENAFQCEILTDDIRTSMEEAGADADTLIDIDICKYQNPLRQTLLCDPNDPQRICAPDYRWTPMLLFNGTHQDSGKRIIASQLEISPNIFTDSFDFHDLANYPISVSTAAHNSARFPGVSPSGTLWAAQPGYRPGLRWWLKGEYFNGHVLDGGYFENNGTATTRDLVLRVFEINKNGFGGRDAQGRFLSVNKFRMKPIFIEITANPDASEAQLDRPLDENWRCPRDVPIKQAQMRKAEQMVVQPSGTEMSCAPGIEGCDSSDSFFRDIFANEFRAPLAGIFNTREARGTYASKNLVENACRSADEEKDDLIAEPVFAQFRICKYSAVDKPGLGWRLAARSRNLMKLHLLDLNEAEALLSDVAEEGTDGAAIEELRETLDVPEGLSDENVEELLECLAHNKRAHDRVVAALQSAANY